MNLSTEQFSDFHLPRSLRIVFELWGPQTTHSKWRR